MKERLNPESKNYIFKNRIEENGLLMSVERLLGILETLTEDFLDRILLKDPKSIYELYNFKTIQEKACNEKNKRLIILLGETTTSDLKNQSSWLKLLSSLSDLLHSDSEEYDMTSEAYIYSLIDKYTFNYTKTDVTKTSFSFEIKNKVREDFLLKDDFEDIDFFMKRKTYGKILAAGVIKERKDYLNKLTKEEAKIILNTIRLKILKYDTELEILKDNKNDYYYKVCHLIKYYIYIETILEYKIED